MQQWDKRGGMVAMLRCPKPVGQYATWRIFTGSGVTHVLSSDPDSK